MKESGAGWREQATQPNSNHFIEKPTQAMNKSPKIHVYQLYKTSSRALVIIVKSVYLAYFRAFQVF